MATVTKTYHGFESIADLERDMSELFSEPAFKDVPSEFDGTITVTITYTPAEGE